MKKIVYVAFLLFMPFLMSAQTDTIKIYKRKQHYFVKLKIEDKVGYALVDTGTNRTVVNRDVIKDNYTVLHFNDKNIAYRLHVVDMNITKHQKAVGLNIVAILGLDFYTKYNATIDFKREYILIN